MALDPGVVPVQEVPEALQSKALSEKLEKKFEDLSNSVLIQKYGLEKPFADYVDVVSQILALRREQKFIPARGIAKRGLLDDAYRHLIGALNDAQQLDEGLVLPLMSAQAENELRETLASVRGAIQSSSKAPALPAPVATVSQSVPVAIKAAHSPLSEPLWALIGFLVALPFGALIYRAVAAPAPAPAAPGLDVPRVKDFDFSLWLRNFRSLVADYRRAHPENENVVKQVQPFLSDTAGFFRKYYQETRETHYRGLFTDHELALQDLVTTLSDSLHHSDEQCRALILHLSVLADAIQSKEREKAA